MPGNDESADASFVSPFHAEQVTVSRFGINLGQSEWGELAASICAHDVVFLDPPHVRMRGMPGEHATLFVLDPSGNALEFKAFANHNDVFARLFARSHGRARQSGHDGERLTGHAPGCVGGAHPGTRGAQNH
jgi:hypothetical protein